MYTSKKNSRKRAKIYGIQLRAKRLVDVSGALFGVLIFTPVLVVISLAILFTMGKPIFFRQERPGFHGKSFTMFKFRTMNIPKPGKDCLQNVEQRVTKLGNFLRISSLDELPEFFNVIRGEMSLVGPRPLLVEYLKKYTAEQNRRHDMLPGITGLAQVYGRNNIPFSKRLELDVRYVDQWNLILDFKILMKTLIDVFKHTDVVSVEDMDKLDDIGLFIKKK